MSISSVPSAVASLLAPVVLLLATGCASHPVSEEAVPVRETWRALQASAVTGPDLSEHTREELRILDLAGVWDEDPESVPARLLAAQTFRPAWSTETARAELLFELAARAEGDNEPTSAMAHYLEAALAARTAVLEAPDDWSAFDLQKRLAADLYDAGVARFLSVGRLLHGYPGAWHGVPTLSGEKPFAIATGKDLWDPGEFDLLLVADELRFAGRLPNRHRDAGYGAPVVLVRPIPEAEAIADHLPRLRSMPATAVLGQRADGTVELELFDPFRARVIETARGPLPLTADVSAALGHLIAMADSPSTQENEGFFHPAEVEARRGIYLLQPYDPERIPVLLVHGLWSHPATWIEVVNEVWGDPELRARYQIWLYLYPTGLSLALNTSALRRDLLALRQQLAPDGLDPAMRDMVVVGHSMGGILTKALVSQGGQGLWDALATRPLDQVVASDADRALLRSICFFEPQPFVGRVVFMSVPFHGSTLAEGVVGGIGSWLISVPDDFEERVAKLLADNPGLFRYPMTGAHDSIDDLSETSPVLLALTALPMREGLPFHSMMGDVTGDGPPDATDGVVAYRSAHLDGASSELVVPSGHSVQRTPRAQLELRRILRLHAGIETGTAETAPRLP